ncbi:MAG: sigma-70 family RNA polymerase sigma factor [Lewinellaceae bacterium]|nr:sigma-70 family RNA polymerase sigma factor [Lewinellaceae bacterium]
MDILLQADQQEYDFLVACLNNERWAQKKLYETYYSTLIVVAQRYANNDEDALDILHEGFIKIFKSLHKFTIGTSLQAWMRTVLVNTAIDYYRKEIRRKTEQIEKATSLTNNTEDVISALSGEEILASLQQIPASYRSIFNLYVIEGYSHREIAQILNITESTSRSNLVKARTKLRDILQTKYNLTGINDRF